MSNNSDKISISAESEFYDFLDFCKKNNIIGIANQLAEIKKYAILPDLRRFIVDYFSADAQNNRFDKEALQEFANLTDRSPATLTPDSWFVPYKDDRKFVPYRCASDYCRVYPTVITEYKGMMHQFTGKCYLRDAEGAIKTNIENAANGAIKPYNIREAIESLVNITRIIDQDKIDLPMEQIMPMPEHTIPTETGLLNLIRKEIGPHSPDYFYTECLPRHYIPGATPEVFLLFLDRLFYGDPDANLKKTQILETIAWTLMNNYNIQGAVVFYGQGGEGKSIIHSVIADLLVNTTSISLAELEADKFKRAELYGSWANLISESSSEIATSEWFKRLTDGTVITVDRKNGHPFQMASRAKIILDVNELPKRDNELRAFYRRVIAIIDFPNLLETVLTPAQISEFVQRMKDPTELDRIFSYVVDNFYGPLVARMKFTGQLSLAEAEQKWEERSNPAKSYLKMKNEAGEILTDVETVKEVLSWNEKRIARYITRENNGEEYLTMVKADVISDAEKWAASQGFPAKTIHGGTLGPALLSLGFPNNTVSKKVSKGNILKAWKDIFIKIDEQELYGVVTAVTDRKNSPLPLSGQSRIDGNRFGNGSPPCSLHVREIHEHEEGKEASVTEVEKPLETTEEKQVTGHFGDPLPDPLPSDLESTENPSKSDVQNEKPHSDGQEDHDVKSSDGLTKLQWPVDRNSEKSDHDSGSQDMKSTPDPTKLQWQSDPRKALFELVEREAPTAQYHSLRPKAIYDMIDVPEISLKDVSDLCEKLHKEGAFNKNSAGAYSVEPEYLRGGDL